MLFVYVPLKVRDLLAAEGEPAQFRQVVIMLWLITEVEPLEFNQLEVSFEA